MHIPVNQISFTKIELFKVKQNIFILVCMLLNMFTIIMRNYCYTYCNARLERLLLVYIHVKIFVEHIVYKPTFKGSLKTATNYVYHYQVKVVDNTETNTHASLSGSVTSYVDPKSLN